MWPGLQSAAYRFKVNPPYFQRLYPEEFSTFSFKKLKKKKRKGEGGSFIIMLTSPAVDPRQRQSKGPT